MDFVQSGKVRSETSALSCWHAAVFTGVSQVAASLARAREGSSAELSCSLTPTSREASTPTLFPLHVVEWVRLGYNVPVLIKFGVYAPRVHPNYKGKLYSDLFSHALLLGDRWKTYYSVGSAEIDALEDLTSDKSFFVCFFSQ